MAKGYNKYAGGGAQNNMNNMLKQAQKMQAEMERVQEEMEQKEYEGTAGGGAVAATVKGSKELVSIKLKPEVVDPDDIEMLEDLVVAAVNEAVKNASADMEEEMGKLTGGVSIPGLF